jgi:hypothetical protein
MRLDSRLLYSVLFDFSALVKLSLLLLDLQVLVPVLLACVPQCPRLVKPD